MHEKTRKEPWIAAPSLAAREDVPREDGLTAKYVKYAKYTKKDGKGTPHCREMQMQWNTSSRPKRGDPDFDIYQYAF